MFFRKKKDKIQLELEEMQRETKKRVEPITTFENPVRASNTGVFKMVIEDVFTITGRGTVVTGKIELGEVRVGDIVFINNIECKVSGIEAFRKFLDAAKAEDTVGLLINLKKVQVSRGDIITK